MVNQIKIKITKKQSSYFLNPRISPSLPGTFHIYQVRSLFSRTIESTWHPNCSDPSTINDWHPLPLLCVSYRLGALLQVSLCKSGWAQKQLVAPSSRIVTHKEDELQKFSLIFSLPSEHKSGKGWKFSRIFFFFHESAFCCPEVLRERDSISERRVVCGPRQPAKLGKVCSLLLCSLWSFWLVCVCVIENVRKVFLQEWERMCRKLWLRLRFLFFFAVFFPELVSYQRKLIISVNNLLELWNNPTPKRRMC